MHSIQPFIAVMFHQTSLVQFHQFHPNMKPVVVAPGLLVVAGSVDSFNGQVDASLGLSRRTVSTTIGAAGPGHAIWLS